MQAFEFKHKGIKRWAKESFHSKNFGGLKAIDFGDTKNIKMKRQWHIYKCQNHRGLFTNPKNPKGVYAKSSFIYFRG